jgi:hypothetical protein
VKRFGNCLSIYGLLLLGLTHCAPKEKEVSKECVVNSDQSTLFKGHWAVRPVPLAVEAVDFSAGELTELQAAIGKWNDFFDSSKGFKLYLSGSSSLTTVSAGGTRVNRSNVCSQTIVTPSGFSNSIKIYKNRSGWSYGSQVMALTSLCPITRPSAQYREFVAAVMEINYQHYFVSGTPIPDLQSIVVHELGHILGLDHSCNSSGCTDAPDNYKSAVMYPALGFDGIYGRVKRNVESNDQERANCLY